MSRGCRADTSRLLDFYVNGTLGDAERARVADHLANCAACAREVAEIEEVVRMLPGAADSLLARTARRTAWLTAAAVALLLATPMAIWIGARRGAPPATKMPRVVSLDLSAGGTRGGPRATVAIAPGVEFVDVRFSVVVDSAATTTLRVYDERDTTIFGPSPVPPWDALGFTRQRIPAALFVTGGRYRLQVESTRPGESPQHFDYLFDIDTEG